VTGLSIDLSGRRALVTGAGQGVGREISLYLAAAGAEVLVNDIDAERAESVVSEIAAEGTARTAVFDVTDWASVQRVVDELGPVDILVNNAGNAGPEGWKAMRPFHETEPEEWGPFIDINLYGVMHCVRAALPGMIGRPDGRIITVVSDSGRTGDANLAPYAAAKAGAAGFSRSIAREVGRHGITVNCVALGTIMPHGTDPDQDLVDEQAKKIVSRYVVRRRGRPTDAAGIVTYLASPDASWITGQTYPVNGGYSFAL
jgi:3-oxoacyl-[acyl-carrier protein] reductase